MTLSRLTLIAILLSTGAYAASTPPANTTNGNFKLTINDLIKQDGFSLQGKGAARQLYLPILPSWNVNKIHLHLLTTRDQSPDLIALTAFVKDFPISSLNLAANKTGETIWDIDIQPKYIDSSLVTVTLRRNWDQQGISCTNFSDPGSWVAFDGDSTITYDYTLKTYEPTLSNFPAPFIIDPSIRRDRALILLPDNFASEELESSYYVANALIKRKTWRGLDLTGDTLGHASDKAKAENNIIVIGVANQIKNLLGTGDWPLKINSDGLLVDNQGTLIPEKTGVLMMATSPWSPQYGLLVVTGNSSDAMIKAGKALRSKNFKQSVLFGKYALVDNIQKKPLNTIDWSDTTLAELGFTDAVVYGGGENNIKYEINLPPNQTPQGMDVALDYSASPLLSGKNSSFISLKVNGFPITGIRISAGDDKKDVWKFHISGENLLPGKNVFNFIFNLKFYNTDCTPDDLSNAWGVIYASSRINAQLDKKKTAITFGDFGGIRQNVSVLLPKDQTIFTQQELIDLVLHMAKNIFQINDFQIFQDSSDIAELNKDANIIYIGSINDNHQLSEQRHHFPFCYLNNRLMVKPALQPYLHVSDETPVALIQLTDSPFNPNQLFLLITANDLKSYKIAIDTFFNPKKNNYLRGNAALAYSDGTFTSIDTERLEVKAENVKLIKATRRTAMIAVISFFGSIFVTILSLIIYRRAKHYFSKTPPKQE